MIVLFGLGFGGIGRIWKRKKVEAMQNNTGRGTTYEAFEGR